MRACAAALLAIALTACSALQRAPQRPAVDPTQVDTFQLSGRINLLVEKEAYPGSLRWRHAPEQDELWFYTPLGATVARLRQDGKGALLVTGDGKEYRASNLTVLAMDVLGWDLPLDSLPYWVRGVRSPQLKVQAEELDEKGRLKRLVQDGWQVSYLDWSYAGVNGLPSKLQVQSDRLRMRLVVDEWTLGKL